MSPSGLPLVMWPALLASAALSATAADQAAKPVRTSPPFTVDRVIEQSGLGTPTSRA